MGLSAPAEPGSLLKPLKDVKAVDPPKKEFGTSKSKDKTSTKPKEEKASEADTPELPAD